MNDVKDYIPHREPFLFVDEIIEVKKGIGIQTKLTLREDFAFFEGHYPEQPIMPGVLMCEAVFQSAGILMSADSESEQEGAPVLTKIENARFRRMALPGEVLLIDVKTLESKGPFHMMRGKITNGGGEAVMSVDFTITQK